MGKQWWHPKNWLSDPDLRRCSRAARSLWFDCLNLMMLADSHRLEGSDGSPMPVSELAQILGDDPRTARSLLSELEKHHVFDRDNDGFIVSRKMLKDRIRSEMARERGRLGGNPTLKEVNLPEKRSTRISAESKPQHRPLDSSEIHAEKISDIGDINGLPKNPVKQEVKQALYIKIPSGSNKIPSGSKSTADAVDRARGADPPQSNILDEVLVAAGIDLDHDPNPTRWFGSGPQWIIGRWQNELGLSKTEILVTLREWRTLRPSFACRSLKFFDGIMEDAAGRKIAPPLQPNGAAHEQQRRRPDPANRGLDAYIRAAAKSP